jgi:hypothetical protein
LPAAELLQWFILGCLGQILTGGRRLWGDDARHAALLSQHLFNQADFMPYRTRILRERRRAWIGI